MQTVPPTPDNLIYRPLPAPRVTPGWAAELEYWAACRGLPPEPWPA
jgi:hypothetical protein